MSTNPRSESAKIYQFPHKGRRSGALLRPNRPSEKSDFKVTPVECGGSWYHQAAIDDASRLRKP